MNRIDWIPAAVGFVGGSIAAWGASVLTALALPNPEHSPETTKNNGLIGGGLVFGTSALAVFHGDKTVRSAGIGSSVGSLITLVQLGMAPVPVDNE